VGVHVRRISQFYTKGNNMTKENKEHLARLIEEIEARAKLREKNKAEDDKYYSCYPNNLPRLIKEIENE
jgi:hypothetical protein